MHVSEYNKRAQADVVKRFCTLSGLVAESQGWRISADCLCDDPRMLHFSHDAVSQIEDIVLASIGRTRADLEKFISAND